ncbi:MAG: VPDSG-CTERM sorting domain-containing protein [Verrucomicrobiota bacterium]
MKKQILAALALSALTSTAFATDITAIYGSGNPDSGWTAATDNGIQLGLRGKNRNTGATPNDGAGTYNFAVGTIWNYEFSINSGNNNLNAYQFYLAVDGNSSQGVNFTTVDPLAYWGDNSYGKTGTSTANNGQGVEGTAATYAGLNNIAQGSQRITFGDYPAGAQSLNVDGTYTFNLFATRIGEGPTGTRLTDLSIDVVVGKGGAAVPDGGSSLALLGLGLAGIAGLQLRRKAA